jgi:hypothetical protein
MSGRRTNFFFVPVQRARVEIVRRTRRRLTFARGRIFFLHFFRESHSKLPVYRWPIHTWRTFYRSDIIAYSLIDDRMKNALENVNKRIRTDRPLFVEIQSNFPNFLTRSRELSLFCPRKLELLDLCRSVDMKLIHNFTPQSIRCCCWCTETIMCSHTIRIRARIPQR